MSIKFIALHMLACLKEFAHDIHSAVSAASKVRNGVIRSYALGNN